MAKDRAKDIARSVGSHEKMMGALGKAAGWQRYSTTDNKSDIAIHKQGTWSEGPKKQFIPGQGAVNEMEFLPANLQGGKGIEKK